MARRVASGASGRIDFGNLALFVNTGDLTLTFWLMLGSGTAINQMIADIEGIGTSELESENASCFLWTSSVSDAWDLRYIHEYGAGINEQNIFDTDLNNDVWYHVAIVRDVSANTVVTYIDGVANATFNYTNDHTYTGSTTVYSIFQRSDGGFQLDDASEADICYYDAALSADEVAGLANGVPNFPFRAANKINYCTLDGNESPEPDYTSNRNNGTVTSTTKANHPSIEHLENFL